MEHSLCLSNLYMTFGEQRGRREGTVIQELASDSPTSGPELRKSFMQVTIKIGFCQTYWCSHICSSSQVQAASISLAEISQGKGLWWLRWQSNDGRIFVRGL